MYKNYINLENFNKTVIMFLKDGKMTSSMTFLFLGSGKVVLEIWRPHHGGIPYNHMVSPKGLTNGTKRHVTCNIPAQNNNLLWE
jgi:hypothetical protein